MKKYSTEARELLSTMEQYEIKAGGEDDGDGTVIVIKPNICTTVCTTCTFCTNECTLCTTCTSCTTKIAS